MNGKRRLLRLPDTGKRFRASMTTRKRREMTLIVDDNLTPPDPQKPQPLGYALMVLRGAIERLETALELQDAQLVLQERKRLNRAVEIFQISAAHPVKDSLITKKYLRVGGEDLAEAYAKLQTASCWLSSLVRAVPN